jgi:hypothetical protein
MSPLAFGLGSSRAFGIARKLGRLYTLGESVGGGYFAGYISHTANGIATHALIVSPKSTGEAPLSTKWKTVASSTPGTNSRFDGFLNTSNMSTDGTHPAADFCRGLTIGGYTDWYFPAIDELQIAYYNLKPTTTNNSTFHGINAYSVPAIVSNYTTTDPAQTSLTIFRSGGSQVLTASATGDLSGYPMWCSTQGGTAQTAFSLDFIAGGYNDGAFKTNGAYVRAFRRIAL